MPKRSWTAALPTIEKTPISAPSNIHPNRAAANAIHLPTADTPVDSVVFETDWRSEFSEWDVDRLFVVIASLYQAVRESTLRSRNRHRENRKYARRNFKARLQSCVSDSHDFS